MQLNDLAEAKFWGNVTPAGDDECWRWTGGTIRHGRGVMWFNGKNHIATHIALSLVGKPRPSAESMACHKCDNPNCVNPAHLWWGSAQENMRDCVDKGRNYTPPSTFAGCCAKGHPRTPENVYSHGNVKQQCRICWNDYRNKWRARRRAEGFKKP